MKQGPLNIKQEKLFFMLSKGVLYW